MFQSREKGLRGTQFAQNKDEEEAKEIGFLLDQEN